MAGTSIVVSASPDLFAAGIVAVMIASGLIFGSVLGVIRNVLGLGYSARERR